MLQRSLDVTLVRLCEAFESERSLVDDELARRQQELVFMATHDPLTGLPNRTLILDRAEQLLARSRREQAAVLRRCSSTSTASRRSTTASATAPATSCCGPSPTRLENTIREADTLGRLGGDEFVILVEGVALAAGPELVAERILDTLKQPFLIEGAASGRVTITASIGIAVGDRGSAADLLRDADIAMYRAKLDGKNRYLVYESGMQDAIHRRMELEMDLREAVGQPASSTLVYQPMFDLDGLTPIRMEALLRWRRPGRRTCRPTSSCRCWRHRA